MLQQLIDSIQALYDRFNISPGKDATRRCFTEEVDEILEVVWNEPGNTDHIAEEAADVMVTAIGICLAYDVTPDQLMTWVGRVIKKNDAKTFLTHTVNRFGKIERIDGND